MTTLRKFSRYVIIGIVLNSALYGCYLGLTAALSVEPKLAMTLTYVAGIGLSFGFNRRWTFGSTISVGRTLPRYFLLYVSGYVINYMGLRLFYDGLGFPHQWIQIAVMSFLMIYLFALSRLWVFK